jgi:spore coat protein CotH
MLGIITSSKIKSGVGVLGNEPADVPSYARKHATFPFETRLDQFFDEGQFESYHELGLHIADSVLREAAERHSTEIGRFNPEAFFAVLH